LILKQNKISHLIIAGIQTEICINSTTRNAIELGFNVTLIKNGHSTFDSEEMKAPEIIEKYNKELNDIAKIEKAEKIRFQKNA
jgi:nicotinamidase-related amidase